jgi:hypothetical protein
MCPDEFTEAIKEVNAYANVEKTGAREVLLALREANAPENKRRSNNAGSCGLHKKEVLLSYLCELERRCDPGRSLCTIQEESEEMLRGLRDGRSTSSTSCESELYGQQQGKSSDALHLLSYVLAQHAMQSFETACKNAEPIHPLSSRVPGRVGQLRAYGNSIVPALAAEFIKAFLGSENLRSCRKSRQSL